MSAPPPGWSRGESPFHAGERAVQERLGARERVERQGRRVIRDFMPDQHRTFYAELPFVVIGSVDAQRRPWASLVVGAPGFARSPDPRTLEVHARAAPGDPLGDHLRVGAPIGLLGIQLETRRRNRVNGTIVRADDGGFALEVGQSFGNCPQYIHVRTPGFVSAPPPRVMARDATLSPRAIERIERADTLFIATSTSEDVDVSHRGGAPGFVRVRGSVITIPDYRGNAHFNTLGNIEVHPRAGLVVVDFETGARVMITGDAEIVWDGPEVDALEGAERAIRIRVTEVIEMASSSLDDQP
ncbi:pyridoxamine 5'-phosphate oxidase family protein [Sandaracinus amylolyticus]|uniref:Putative iron-sulfur binding protein n=1 Tax=Sandaracinus amylolyticus TaxID=927083 RepID=A0A0F6SI54_9BACT|nr:pyridoxamine 5'-phosphate oxidase family protein [Sandaracinus amylolyticus]AKF11599.1 putative iron-sulfur binding protein [Sandaracinus amylolyticus]